MSREQFAAIHSTHMQSRYSWWIFDRYCFQSRGKPLSPADLHLNVDAMREAASMLLGLQDCSALMDVKRGQGEKEGTCLLY